MLLNSVKSDNIDFLLDLYNILKKSTVKFCEKHKKTLELTITGNELIIKLI